jgi:predicted phosphodiesterase
MAKLNYRGLLAIGDPHLASRVPGFRKDEYPKTVLRKLTWCVDYARKEHLLPCLLGDVFHWPRDNANWLLGSLLELFQQEVIAIAGNHDCTENTLGENDSLSVIAKAGQLRLLDHTGPWRGFMRGRPVVIGGTSWGAALPDGALAAKQEPNALVFWLLHDDVSFPGYDAGHIEPRPIPGIDAVINGHIHRPSDPVIAGNTVWLNPGNIARVKRSDSTRECIPSVLRIDVDAPEGSESESDGLLWSASAAVAPLGVDARRGWHMRRIEIPHEPFEQVFHEQVVAEPIASGESAFVQGLAELVARRTESGAGLREFLNQNLGQFDDRVAQEIITLAEEVLENARN